MKSEDSKKSISNLVSQKVDSEKIQGGGGGGAKPEPFKLTKDEVRSFESSESGFSHGGSSTPSNITFNKHGRANKKGL